MARTTAALTLLFILVLVSGCEMLQLLGDEMKPYRRCVKTLSSHKCPITSCTEQCCMDLCVSKYGGGGRNPVGECIQYPHFAPKFYCSCGYFC
ncbi:hypothetical protein ABFS82_02G031500 [Erythranthe guttata]